MLVFEPPQRLASHAGITQFPAPPGCSRAGSEWHLPYLLHLLPHFQAYFDTGSFSHLCELRGIRELDEIHLAEEKDVLQA